MKFVFTQAHEQALIDSINDVEQAIDHYGDDDGNEKFGLTDQAERLAEILAYVRKSMLSS